MYRLSRKEFLMQITNLVSLRSTCPRAQVGATIVKEGRVISMGYNGSPSGTPHCFDVGCLLNNEGHCIRTIHAEINAIVFAARMGIKTEGAEIYITHSPCLECAKAIINAGIKKVIYEHIYEPHSGLDLLSEIGITIEKFRGEL